MNTISNPLTKKHLSVVSIWEIVMKMNIGKLKLKDDIASIYKLLQKGEIEILSPAQDDFEIYQNLPLIHKDPFDRMIISQALANDLTLITDDQHIKNYPNLKLF
ncbi:type II toxin-antitoxin system VapC family toxin [Pedobacter aquatilis]|nr:type II toxin-antitoxin system VapC family toxin [Pedobacter aquatilis]MDN3585850.1 type II toxin-antitoxin system VapC family toxin [Pedobacter aquatilis]